MRDRQVKKGKLLEMTVKKGKIDGFDVLKGMKPFTAEEELKSA